MTHKIKANASGTRSIDISDTHLETLKRYSLLDNLVGSNGIVDELLSGESGTDKDLLDLCLDVVYHRDMKAIGLQNLITLYNSQCLS